MGLIDIGRQVDLFDVLPTGTDKFYVCGEDGTLGLWENGKVRFIDLPTDATLFALAQDAKGNIVVGGEGVLFRGTGQTWGSIDVGEIDFHHARRHGEFVNLGGAEDGLYRLAGSNLDRVSDDFVSYYLADCGILVGTCGLNMVWILDRDESYSI